MNCPKKIMVRVKKGKFKFITTMGIGHTNMGNKKVIKIQAKYVTKS